MKRWFPAFIVLTALFAAITIGQGPRTPAMNLRVRADSNGALLVTSNTAAAQGPLTNFGNLQLRTDSNGALLVASTASGGAVDNTCWSSTTKDSYIQEVGANNPGAYTNGTNCAAGALRFDWSSAGINMAPALKYGFAGSGNAVSLNGTLTAIRPADGGAYFNVGNGTVQVNSAILQLANGGVVMGGIPVVSVDGQIQLTNGGATLQIRHNISAVTQSVTFRTAGTAETITGNSSAFRIVVGGTPGTTSTVTFGTAWTVAPICHVENETTANIMRPTASTGTLVLNGIVVAGDSIAVLCEGY